MRALSGARCTRTDARLYTYYEYRKVPEQAPANARLVKLTSGVVIDSEPHVSCTWKTSLLFTPLDVRVYTGCSALQSNETVYTHAY